MEVDQDIPEQGTPPGTPFEEGLTPSTTQGQTANPTGGVYTQNYYTPLYDESQVSDRSTGITNRQHPAPIRTRNEAIRDAKLAATMETKTVGTYTSGSGAQLPRHGGVLCTNINNCTNITHHYHPRDSHH